MTRLISFAVLAAALGASAQSLSSQCTSALAQIATNPSSACLSPSSLLPLITSAGNSSLVSGVDSWLTNVCGVAPCSNDTLAAIVTNVTAGCSSDLSAFGFTSGNSATLVSTVQQFYPTVRNVACLKDGSTLCVTETLTNLQNAVGNLTATSIAGLIATGNATLPSNVTCSNCVKAGYNTVNSAFPGLLGSSNSTLQSQCGSSFTDGSAPAGIVESATNSSSSGSSPPSSGAVAISGNILSGLGASVLIVFGSTFMML